MHETLRLRRKEIRSRKQRLLHLRRHQRQHFKDSRLRKEIRTLEKRSRLLRRIELRHQRTRRIEIQMPLKSRRQEMALRRQITRHLRSQLQTEAHILPDHIIQHMTILSKRELMRLRPGIKSRPHIRLRRERTPRSRIKSLLHPFPKNTRQTHLAFHDLIILHRAPSLLSIFPLLYNKKGTEKERLRGKIRKEILHFSPNGI